MTAPRETPRSCRTCGWWRPLWEGQTRALCMHEQRADEAGNARMTLWTVGKECVHWQTGGKR